MEAIFGLYHQYGAWKRSVHCLMSSRTLLGLYPPRSRSVHELQRTKWGIRGDFGKGGNELCSAEPSPDRRRSIVCLPIRTRGRNLVGLLMNGGENLTVSNSKEPCVHPRTKIEGEVGSNARQAKSRRDEAARLRTHERGGSNSVENPRQGVRRPLEC